jgi:hypothetical protein
MYEINELTRVGETGSSLPSTSSKLLFLYFFSLFLLILVLYLFSLCEWHGRCCASISLRDQFPSTQCQRNRMLLHSSLSDRFLTASFSHLQNSVSLNHIRSSKFKLSSITTSWLHRLAESVRYISAGNVIGSLFGMTIPLRLSLDCPPPYHLSRANPPLY